MNTGRASIRRPAAAALSIAVLASLAVVSVALAAEQVGGNPPAPSGTEPVLPGADYLIRVGLEVLVFAIGVSIAIVGSVRYRAARRAQAVVRGPASSPATRTQQGR